MGCLWCMHERLEYFYGVRLITTAAYGNNRNSSHPINIRSPPCLHCPSTMQGYLSLTPSPSYHFMTITIHHSPPYCVLGKTPFLSATPPQALLGKVLHLEIVLTPPPRAVRHCVLRHRVHAENKVPMSTRRVREEHIPMKVPFKKGMGMNHKRW